MNEIVEILEEMINHVWDYSGIRDTYHCRYCGCEMEDFFVHDRRDAPIHLKDCVILKAKKRLEDMNEGS